VPQSNASRRSPSDGSPIGPQYFLSYSRHDDVKAGKLERELTDLGLTVWRDHAQLRKGDHWLPEAKQGILHSDAVLFLHSEKSSRSYPCKEELEHAAYLGKRIVPILLDDTPVTDALLTGRVWLHYPAREDSHNLSHLVGDLNRDPVYERLHKRLTINAEVWEANGRPPSRLLRSRDLRDAQTHKIVSRANDRDILRAPFFPPLVPFILISRQRQQYRRTIALTSSLALVGFLLVLLVALLRSQSRLHSTEREQDASALATASMQTLEADPGLAVDLAIRALETDGGSNLARRAAVTALAVVPGNAQITQGATESILAVDEKGQLIAVAQDSRTLHMRDPTGATLWKRDFNPGELVLAEFAEPSMLVVPGHSVTFLINEVDGSTVAEFLTDSRGVPLGISVSGSRVVVNGRFVLDTKLLKSLALRRGGTSYRSVALSGDGEVVAIDDFSGQVHLFSSSDGNPIHQAIDSEISPANGIASGWSPPLIALSETGRFIAIEREDGVEVISLATESTVVRRSLRSQLEDLMFIDDETAILLCEREIIKVILDGPDDSLDSTLITNRRNRAIASLDDAADLLTTFTAGSVQRIDITNWAQIDEFIIESTNNQTLPLLAAESEVLLDTTSGRLYNLWQTTLRRLEVHTAFASVESLRFDGLALTSTSGSEFMQFQANSGLLEFRREVNQATAQGPTVVATCPPWTSPAVVTDAREGESEWQVFSPECSTTALRRGTTVEIRPAAILENNARGLLGEAISLYEFDSEIAGPVFAGEDSLVISHAGELLRLRFGNTERIVSLNGPHERWFVAGAHAFVQNGESVDIYRIAERVAHVGAVPNCSIDEGPHPSSRSFKYLLLRCDDGLRQIDLANARATGLTACGTDTFNAVLSDEGAVASFDREGTRVQICDQDGALAGSLEFEDDPVTSMVFLDGDRLAIGSTQGAVFIWDSGLDLSPESLLATLRNAT
jgi:hypothetical protein